jgi:hypothetical protein
MADQIQVFLSSRRTVMSGEVVTFAARFEPWDSAFGKAYRAVGPFNVSASRDAVMVHHAECKSAEEVAALCFALSLAERARSELAPHWRGGHPSLYPEEPTVFPDTSGVSPSRYPTLPRDTPAKEG